MQLLLSRVDGNTFTSPDGLRVHIKENHLPKRHACSLCGYTTNRFGHLGHCIKRKHDSHQQVVKIGVTSTGVVNHLEEVIMKSSSQAPEE